MPSYWAVLPNRAGDCADRNDAHVQIEVVFAAEDLNHSRLPTDAVLHGHDAHAALTACVLRKGIAFRQLEGNLRLAGITPSKR